MTFEIPVIAMFYPTPPLNTGKREKDRRLSGDYLLDVCTSSMYVLKINHSQLQLKNLYLIRGYVCKHIVHVLYIGTYRVMVITLFKTDWLDE